MGFAPVALRAPALREGWRVPRNPGSTDNRCRRSIKCSVRYWASTHEIQEARKHHVELVELRVDAPLALGSSEQPFDLVRQLAEFAGVVPFAFGGMTDVIPMLLGKAAGLVAFAGAVHRHRLAPAFQQGTVFGRVVGIAAGQEKSLPDGNLPSVPSAAGLADALRPDAVWMHLDTGAVKAEAVRILAGHMLLSKRREQPVEHAVAGSAEKPGVRRLSFSETLRQGALLAAVIYDVRKGINEGTYILNCTRDKNTVPILNLFSSQNRTKFLKWAYSEIPFILRRRITLAQA